MADLIFKNKQIILRTKIYNWRHATITFMVLFYLCVTSNRIIKVKTVKCCSVKTAVHYFDVMLTCMQYIEADDLEPATKDTQPVKYHEAWQQLCNCDGVLVPGGFGTRGIEGKILAAEWARTAKKPYLGMYAFIILFMFISDFCFMIVLHCVSSVRKFATYEHKHHCD